MSQTEKISSLSIEQAQQLLYQMILIRQFEEKSAELYSATKIRGFLHLYTGEEAIAVGVIANLTEEDAVVATYREHGHALAKGVSASSIMAEMFGKQEGCSRGRGGSMHIFDKKMRFYGGNAIVSGHLPLAVGLSLADKMQQKNRVTCCFFGEGSVAEGEFHESMNLASLWNLPVLFLCENNFYAMGTALKRSEAMTDLYRKAEGYNVTSAQVDGMDILAVKTEAQKAIAHIRAGKGPYFLECKTYRFRAHSMFDAELYRAKSEVEEWKKRCPITHFTQQLLQEKMITTTDIQSIEKKVRQEIDTAVAFAEAGTLEPIEDLTRFVYSERGNNE